MELVVTVRSTLPVAKSSSQAFFRFRRHGAVPEPRSPCPVPPKWRWPSRAGRETAWSSWPCGAGLSAALRCPAGPDRRYRTCAAAPARGVASATPASPRKCRLSHFSLLTAEEHHRGRRADRHELAGEARHAVRANTERWSDCQRAGSSSKRCLPSGDSVKLRGVEPPVGTLETRFTLPSDWTQTWRWSHGSDWRHRDVCRPWLSAVPRWYCCPGSPTAGSRLKSLSPSVSPPSKL